MNSRHFAKPAKWFPHLWGSLATTTHCRSTSMWRPANRCTNDMGKSFSPLLGSIEKAKHVPKEITEKTRHTVTKWVFQLPSWEPGMTSTRGRAQNQGTDGRATIRSSLVFESSMKIMAVHIHMVGNDYLPWKNHPSQRWNLKSSIFQIRDFGRAHDDATQFLILFLGGVPRLANKWNCTKLYWLFSPRSVFTKTFGRAHVTLSGQTIVQLLPLGRMGGFPSLKPEVLVSVGKSKTIPDSQGLLHCNLKSDKVNFAAKTLSQQNRTVAASLK